jgi:hypothetical protein
MKLERASAARDFRGKLTSIDPSPFRCFAVQIQCGYLLGGGVEAVPVGVREPGTL